MTATNHATATMNQNTKGQTYTPGGGTGLQGKPIGACPQNEGLPSKGGDSRQTAEAYGLQWLCNVVFGIGRLVGDLPIHVETPDGMSLLKADCPKGGSDNPGRKGQNGSSVLGRNTPNPTPNYEDGTWMTIHIQIPRTTSIPSVRPKSLRRSNDDSTHGRIGIAIDTNSCHCNKAGYNERSPLCSTSDNP